jgi:hypothetical protein
MRYKCKIDFYHGNCLLFEKDMWYHENVFKLNQFDKHTFFVGSNINNRVQSNIYHDQFTITNQDLSNHFFSVAEVREMEINKILTDE